VAPAKAKLAALKPQGEKSQPASKEGPSKKEDVKATQKKEESDKENIEQIAATVPEEPSVTETNDAIIGVPEPEVSAEAVVEDVAEKPAEPIITEAESEASPEPTVKPAEPSVEPIATEAAVEVSTEPVATNSHETSDHQEETTEDIEVPAEIPATETAKESSEHAEEVPAANDVEDVPSETVIKTNGEEQSAESQPEPKAPKEEIFEAVVEPTEPVVTEDVPTTEEKETPKAESELAEQTETPVSTSIDDAPEIKDDSSEAQPSDKIQEPKESIPVVEAAAPAKPDTADIDFASLALN
jgi:hypothetical protein